MELIDEVLNLSRLISSLEDLPGLRPLRAAITEI
jgi:hypothetical protein